MRIWFKEWKENRMLRDFVACEENDDTRTHKIFHALEQACYEFDLSRPLWLDSNIAEFKRHAKTRFSGNADNRRINHIKYEKNYEISFFTIKC